MNTPPKGISVKKKFWAIMVLAAIGMTITVMVSLLALRVICWMIARSKHAT